MIVLRVEHILSEYGCYCGYYSERSEDMENALMIHSEDMIKWPTSAKDIGRFARVGERHGFINKKQLHNWFSKQDLKIMWDCGYYVRRYHDVTITAIGEKQILFKHESFTEV